MRASSFTKAIAIENDIRGPLRNFGLKVGAVGTVRFEQRIRELLAGIEALTEIVEPLLDARPPSALHGSAPHAADDRAG